MPGTSPSVTAHSLRRCELDDIDAIKKRYRVMSSVPTFGLLHMSRLAAETVYDDLEWNIDAREVFWAYLITPRPSKPEALSIKGGVETFIHKKQDNGLLFVSEKPMPLSASGQKGMSLVSGSDDLPILENLPSPGLDQVQWDKDLKNYRGTVLSDLRWHGTTL